MNRDLALTDEGPWPVEPYGTNAVGAPIQREETTPTLDLPTLLRIGIDTGAFYTGVLTALAIEGGHRWFLQTGDENVGDDCLFPA